MENSKRRFLLGACAVAVGGSGLALARSQAGTGTGSNIYQSRLGLVHDETKCIGCDKCSIACREVNQVPEGVSRLEIKRHGPYGEYPEQYYRFTRKSCMHCENAPCVLVCPTGAAYRDPDTGIVCVDEWKCVGCLYCIAACPYQVRFIHPETKAADKCDFCKETNLKQGKQPACVEACPTKALTFGDLNDPDTQIIQVLNETPNYRYKSELGTRPKLFSIAAKGGDITL